MRINKKKLEQRHNRELQELKLNLSYLSDVDVPLICNYLKNHPEIVTLNIWGNKISSEGAKELAAITTLRTLIIGFNDIGVEGAKAIAVNKNITNLNVAHSNIESEGVTALLANTTLTSLDIRTCGVEAKDVVNALKSNQRIINLYYNFFQNYKYKNEINMIERYLLRNKVRPWYTTLMNARLMSQAYRSDNCLLGKLPVEVIGLINDYVVGANHFSFFIRQINKRPIAQDFISVKQMAQL